MVEGSPSTVTFRRQARKWAPAYRKYLLNNFLAPELHPRVQARLPTAPSLGEPHNRQEQYSDVTSVRLLILPKVPIQSYISYYYQCSSWQLRDALIKMLRTKAFSQGYSFVAAEDAQETFYRLAQLSEAGSGVQQEP